METTRGGNGTKLQPGIRLLFFLTVNLLSDLKTIFRTTMECLYLASVLAALMLHVQHE